MKASAEPRLLLGQSRRRLPAIEASRGVEKPHDQRAMKENVETRMQRALEWVMEGKVGIAGIAFTGFVDHGRGFVAIEMNRKRPRGTYVPQKRDVFPSNGVRLLVRAYDPNTEAIVVINEPPSPILILTLPLASAADG